MASNLYFEFTSALGYLCYNYFTVDQNLFFSTVLKDFAQECEKTYNPILNFAGALLFVIDGVISLFGGNWQNKWTKIADDQLIKVNFMKVISMLANFEKLSQTIFTSKTVLFLTVIASSYFLTGCSGAPGKITINLFKIFVR